jgi:hypothetical protein
MDTDVAMDDADAHIYTTTTIMHGERKAKTGDDDHSSRIGGTPASHLVEVINQGLSETSGIRRPRRPSRICSTVDYGAHIHAREPICIFKI